MLPRYSKTSFTKIFDLYLKAPLMNNLPCCWASYLQKTLLQFYCWIIYYQPNEPCCTYCEIKLLFTVRCSLQSRYLQFVRNAPFKLSTWYNRSSFYNPSLHTNVPTLVNIAILSLIVLDLKSFYSHWTQTLYSNVTNHIACGWIQYGIQMKILKSTLEGYLPGQHQAKSKGNYAQACPWIHPKGTPIIAGPGTCQLPTITVLLNLLWAVIGLGWKNTFFPLLNFRHFVVLKSRSKRES